MVRTGLPPDKADFAGLEVDGVEIAGTAAGGDSAGAADVTTGALFIGALSAANPLPNVDESPVVFIRLGPVKPGAEDK